MSQAVEAYRGITATEEFKYKEALRARARHDEAQALSNAKRQRDAHWQAVVADKDAALADKDAENERLKSMLAELQAKLSEK